MLAIKKKYIVDEAQQKIAVQMDIKTFEKIEKLLEDHALYKKMSDNNKADRMHLKEAKAFYSKLKKS